MFVLIELHKIGENEMKECQFISKQKVNVSKRAEITPVLSTLAIAVRASILALSLASGVVQAATIQVTSSADDNGNGCTLREAVVSMNDQVLQNDCTNPSGTAFGVNDSIFFSSSLPNNNSITLVNGQLSINSDRNINIDASDISGGVTVNAANQSRVFYLNSATLSIDNLAITNGNSDGYGGAIYLSESDVSVNNSTFSGNFSDDSGGAISLNYNSSISIIDSTITGNSSTYNGGAIEAYDNSTVSLTGSTVSGNTSDSHAGAIYIFESQVSLIDSTVMLNVAASGSGGAVYAISNSSVSITNSSVSENSATIDGGGLYSSESEITLVGSNLQLNSAADDGGGVYAIDNSNISFNNSTVSGNSAVDGLGGGAVIKDSSSMLLSSSTVSGNSAYSGGGIHVDINSNAVLINATVSGNSASNRSGGIYIANTSTLSLGNSTVSDNLAVNYGGVGGVYVGGVYVASSSSMVLSNSIIANSIGGSDCHAQNISSDTASIIEDGDGGCGTNARIGDPGLEPLTDNGGATKTHALKASSISRNTGILFDSNNNGGDCTTYDQRGELRDAGDGKCDVGAFEYFDDSMFFVIPTRNGKAVVVPL